MLLKAVPNDGSQSVREYHLFLLVWAVAVLSVSEVIFFQSNPPYFLYWACAKIPAKRGGAHLAFTVDLYYINVGL